MDDDQDIHYNLKKEENENEMNNYLKDGKVK